MARLRFPGRPGQRFDRKGIKFASYDRGNAEDPSMKLVAELYCGLRVFYDLFGESDEETDFTGFSRSEISKANKEYAAAIAPFDDDDESPDRIKKYPAPVPNDHSNSLLNAQNQGRQIPAPSKRNVAKKNIAKTAKTAVAKVETKSEDIQFLDERQKPVKRLDQTKKFVLPTTTRSARKITPSRRFLEQEDTFSSPDVSVANPRLAELPTGSSESGTELLSPPLKLETEFFSNDQDNGKRLRKPSQKILEIQRDGKEPPPADANVSLEEEKIIPNEEKTSPMEKRAQEIYKSGNDILAKPKLHLNKRTLNRSKHAFARTLKREIQKQRGNLPSIGRPRTNAVQKAYDKCPDDILPMTSSSFVAGCDVVSDVKMELDHVPDVSRSLPPNLESPYTTPAHAQKPPGEVLPPMPCRGVSYNLGVLDRLMKEAKDASEGPVTIAEWARPSHAVPTVVESIPAPRSTPLPSIPTDLRRSHDPSFQRPGAPGPPGQMGPPRQGLRMKMPSWQAGKYGKRALKNYLLKEKNSVGRPLGRPPAKPTCITAKPKVKKESRAPTRGGHLVSWRLGLTLALNRRSMLSMACFVCGSFGQQRFVSCKRCCGLYHYFCLGEASRPREDLHEWLCNRCVPCNNCSDSKLEKECCMLLTNHVPEQTDWKIPPSQFSLVAMPPSSDHTYCTTIERVLLARSEQRKPVIPASPRQALDLGGLSEQTSQLACALCHRRGDKLPGAEGRLLWTGTGDWVHVNCALYSAEVYEEHCGLLKNVQAAITRGKFLRCKYCNDTGATVGCCARACALNYHFSCARTAHAIIQTDMQVFCLQHHEMANKQLLYDFSVNRPLMIEGSEIDRLWKQPAHKMRLDRTTFINGSVKVTNLGKLTSMSDTRNYLFPIGYTCTRVFWSTQDPTRLCVYTLKIVIGPVCTTPIKRKGFTVDRPRKPPPKMATPAPVQQLFQKEIEEKAIKNEEKEQQELESCAEILASFSAQSRERKISELDLRASEKHRTSSVADTAKSNSGISEQTRMKLVEKSKKRASPVCDTKSISDETSSMKSETAISDKKSNDSSDRDKKSPSPTPRLEPGTLIPDADEKGNIRLKYLKPVYFKDKLIGSRLEYLDPEKLDALTYARLLAYLSEQLGTQLSAAPNVKLPPGESDSSERKTPVSNEMSTEESSTISVSKDVWDKNKTPSETGTKKPDSVSVPTATSCEKSTHSISVSTEDSTMKTGLSVSEPKPGPSKTKVETRDPTASENNTVPGNIGEHLANIQAQIQAHSDTNEGPFKCANCKRSYRTRDSYQSHVRDCNFSISSSEDEEEPQRKRKIGHENSVAKRPRTERIAVPDLKESGADSGLDTDSEKDTKDMAVQASQSDIVDSVAQQRQQQQHFMLRQPTVRELLTQGRNSPTANQGLVQLPSPNQGQVQQSASNQGHLQQPPTDQGQVLQMSTNQGQVQRITSVNPAQQTTVNQNPGFVVGGGAVQGLTNQQLVQGQLMTNQLASPQSMLVNQTALQWTGNGLLVRPVNADSLNNQFSSLMNQVQVATLPTITMPPIYIDQNQFMNFNLGQLVNQHSGLVNLIQSTNSVQNSGLSLAVQAANQRAQQNQTFLQMVDTSPPQQRNLQMTQQYSGLVVATPATPLQQSPLQQSPLQSSQLQQSPLQPPSLQQPSQPNQVAQIGIAQISPQTIQMQMAQNVQISPQQWQQIARSAQQAQPIQQARLVQQTQSIQPMQRVQSMQQIPPMQQARPVQPLQQAQTVQQLQQTQAMQPLQQTQTVQQVQQSPTLQRIAMKLPQVQQAPSQQSTSIRVPISSQPNHLTPMVENQMRNLLQQHVRDAEIAGNSVHNYLHQQLQNPVQQVPDLVSASQHQASSSVSYATAQASLQSPQIQPKIRYTHYDPQLMQKQYAAKSAQQQSIATSQDAVADTAQQQGNVASVQVTASSAYEQRLQQQQVQQQQPSQTSKVKINGQIREFLPANSHGHWTAGPGTSQTKMDSGTTASCSSVNSVVRSTTEGYRIAEPSTSRTTVESSLGAPHGASLGAHGAPFGAPHGAPRSHVSKLQTMCDDLRSRDGDSESTLTGDSAPDDKAAALLSPDKISPPRPLGSPAPKTLKLPLRPTKLGVNFTIKSIEGFEIVADEADKAVAELSRKVSKERMKKGLKPLPLEPVPGVEFFGLNNKNVQRAIEQLPGTENIRRYQFKFRRESKEEDKEKELPVNETGCARTEPYHGRRKYDMFSFLLSKHRKPPAFKIQPNNNNEMVHKSSRRTTSLDLPLPIRFRHLRAHAREAVGAYRSPIHGRGLFCKRAIDAGEMIIEYAGQVIRSSLTDTRERYYESKGIGCYMFRMDDDAVVDATVHGNAARFINHSCEPNCYSKVINVGGMKHIVIFALRPIRIGEELTYDYKFPIEDVKIPCKCQARRCRRYLN